MFWHFVSIWACVKAAVKEEETVSESAVPKWSNLTLESVAYFEISPFSQLCAAL